MPCPLGVRSLLEVEQHLAAGGGRSRDPDPIDPDLHLVGARPLGDGMDRMYWYLQSTTRNALPLSVSDACTGASFTSPVVDTLPLPTSIAAAGRSQVGANAPPGEVTKVYEFPFTVVSLMVARWLPAQPESSTSDARMTSSPPTRVSACA